MILRQDGGWGPRRIQTHVHGRGSITFKKILAVDCSNKLVRTGSKAVSFQTTTSIESLQALITRFANAGWIDNAGIANSLQKKLAANNLDGFASEVKAQNGKHILSQAANYLLRDAYYLFQK